MFFNFFSFLFFQHQEVLCFEGGEATYVACGLVTSFEAVLHSWNLWFYKSVKP
jgi:hypothetical protein